MWNAALGEYGLLDSSGSIRMLTEKFPVSQSTGWVVA